MVTEVESHYCHWVRYGRGAPGNRSRQSLVRQARLRRCHRYPANVLRQSVAGKATGCPEVS